VTADPENPSATALRALIEQGDAFRPYVPTQLFEGAAVHTLKHGERAMLSKLRTMTDAEFEALPYGSEGLWRKLMHASRTDATLEDIIASVKTKRYTRTRIQRMILCAFLGITAEMLQAEIPYSRVLGFTETGRGILKEAKKSGSYINAGEKSDHPYWQLEKRCADLYGLFAVDIPEPPGAEERLRIVRK
jgi:predicted nucleotidyltransferase